VIDIRLLRDKPDEVRQGYARLGTLVDLDKVMAEDARVRDLKNESQTLQAEQNRISKDIGKAAAGPAREEAKAASLALKERIERLTRDLTEQEAALDLLLLDLPNLPHPSVPTGKDETENKVVREELTRRTFDFAPQPHWDLGTKLGIIDFERGVKISGTRF
jgi:seryl-tRNA synthetase